MTDGTVRRGAPALATGMLRDDHRVMSDQRRLFYLDNLRAVVIVLVVVLHAAITYMTPAPEWWYVIDPDQHYEYTALVLLLDVPLMPIMFFAAGFFATPSLQRRGPRGFLREKAIRLGLPWVLGVIFLAPLETYMTYVSRDVPVGYLQFWTGDFWGPLFQQSVYWFLGVLFVGFLVFVYAAVFPARSLLGDPEPARRAPTPLFLATFLALTAGGSVLFTVALGIDDWRSLGWFLVIQPVRVAFYVGFFILGVLAERRGWFRGDGYQPAVALWVPLAMITAGAYFSVRWTLSQYDFGVRVLTSALFAGLCLAALLAGVAVFRRWLDRSGPGWRSLATNSFGIYYLHPLVLYPLAWVIRPATIPAVAKFAILVVVTLAVSWVASALVLQRAPGLRRMFRGS